MENVKLSSPWYSYYHKLQALFDEDPAIKMDFNEEDYEIKIYVEGQIKADAITQLLPSEILFGAVKVKITVISANLEMSHAQLIRDAFNSNPALSYIVTVDAYNNPITYVVFANKVVQYFNDNLHDVNGVESTLYQNLAAELLGEDKGVYFCTDISE